VKQFLILTILTVLFIGCLEQSSDEKLKNQQEQIMKQANAELGMPAIVNFQERKMMKMILELRDQENVICYAYIFSQFQGKFVFVGKCIGYGLPYATQYTSPEKVDSYSASITLPQADPNGLFMPSSAEGTWLMMKDNDGKPRPTYFEERVCVFPFKRGE